MNRKYRIPASFFLAAVSVLSCKEAGSGLKWVDLRYLAEDAYEIPAFSPEPILLQVKSTDPWTVRGRDGRWCTISPSEGGADQLFDVVVRYNDNPDLDDRLDTLVIQSDYWIGKWIPVRQKGTAYLDLEDAAGLEVGQDGGSGRFGIRSNQDWSIVPDASAPWLKVTEGLSGSGDGDVAFSVEVENKGERRTAWLQVLDRHGVPVQQVPVVQGGVELVPETTLLKTDYRPKTLSIAVSSNAAWSVEKENESLSWLDFETVSFEGDGILQVTLAQNDGNAIRTAAIRLLSPEVEGAGRVVKTVVIRQAHDPAPAYHEFDKSEVSDWIINNPDNKNSSLAVVGDDFKVQGAQKIHRYKLPAGHYDFFVKEASEGAIPVIYFQTESLDFHWFIKPSAATTNLNVTDKGKAKAFAGLDVPYDNAVPHTLGIRMSADDQGYLVMSWLLDGRVLGSYAADGSDIYTSAIAFRQDVEFHVFVGAYESGTANQHVVWDAWQYTLPYDFIDWGE